MTRANHCIMILLVLWASTNAQITTYASTGPGGAGGFAISGSGDATGGPGGASGSIYSSNTIIPAGTPCSCFNNEEIKNFFNTGSGGTGGFAISGSGNATGGPGGDSGSIYSSNTISSGGYCCCQANGCGTCYNSCWCY